LIRKYDSNRVAYVQVIHGLKNYQSIITYVAGGSAISPSSRYVSFIKPEMDLARDGADIFSVYRDEDIFIKVISQDTVKIIYPGPEDNVTKKEIDKYNIHFIYERNPKYFNELH
jgi:hypothetical protein